MHAALAARAFEAGVVEYLADDEAAGFLGGHLAGDGRHRGQQADGNARLRTIPALRLTPQLYKQPTAPIFRPDELCTAVRRQILNVFTRF